MESAFDTRAYLAAIEAGDGPESAARAAGVTPEQVAAFLADAPEYIAQVEAAQRYSVEQVEAALYEAAVSGNVPAIQMWLRHRQPERWGTAPTRPDQIGPELTPGDTSSDLRALLDS